MTTDRATELIAAYLAEQLSDAESTRLEQWLAERPENQAFFNEMVAVWQLTEGVSAPTLPGVQPQLAWERLQARLFAEEPATAAPVEPPTAALQRRLPYLRWTAAAAVALLLAVGLYWLRTPGPAVPIATDPYRVLTTDSVASLAHSLPDGSQVWLNARSQLRYDTTFGERRVSLRGEAFFEVVKDSLRPFRIVTGEATTTVLGTSFNVRAYGAETVEVTVVTGQVELAHATQRVVLRPGHTGVYLAQQDSIKALDETRPNAAAWQQQRLDFSQQDLREVLPALERYFGVTFEVENPQLLNCNFSVVFDQPELDEILQSLAFAFDAQAERPNAQRVILRGGRACQ